MELDARTKQFFINTFPAVSIITNAITPGTVIDSRGFESITFAMMISSLAGVATHEMQLLHGDITPNIIVPDAEIIGTSKTLSVVGINALGYIGKKQFISAEITTTGITGSPVKASGTFTFNGTATAGGTITVTVHSFPNRVYPVVITNGQTQTVIGNTLAALITADTGAPFVASNSNGIVTITAKEVGIVPNTWTISSTGIVTGVLTDSVDFSGGSGSESLVGVTAILSSPHRAPTVDQ